MRSCISRRTPRGGRSRRTSPSSRLRHQRPAINDSDNCTLAEQRTNEQPAAAPSGRGRRDSQRAGAPGEGLAKREPDRAKPKEKSSQILRPSPCLSQRERDRSHTTQRYNATMRKINLGVGIVVAAIVIVVVALLLLVDVNRYRGAVHAKLVRQLCMRVNLGRMTMVIMTLRLHI